MIELKIEKKRDNTERVVVRIQRNDNLKDIISDFQALLKHFCTPVMIRTAKVHYNPAVGLTGAFPLKLFLLNGTEIWVDNIHPKDCPKVLALAGFRENDYELGKLFPLDREG